MELSNEKIVKADNTSTYVYAIVFVYVTPNIHTTLSSGVFTLGLTGALAPPSASVAPPSIF